VAIVDMRTANRVIDYNESTNPTKDQTNDY